MDINHGVVNPEDRLSRISSRAISADPAVVTEVAGLYCATLMQTGVHCTMKYPAIWLLGEGAHGEVLSIAFAGEDQHLDAGGKVVHMAPKTTSTITSKSISRGGGRASYRGLLEVGEGG